MRKILVVHDSMSSIPGRGPPAKLHRGKYGVHDPAVGPAERLVMTARKGKGRSKCKDPRHKRGTKGKNEECAEQTSDGAARKKVSKRTPWLALRFQCDAHPKDRKTRRRAERIDV